MGTVLLILGSLFISFLAILCILGIEIIDIKNGHRPDFLFIVFFSLVSMVPFVNGFMLLICGGMLFGKILRQYGYIGKLEDYIIKLIRG